MYHQVTSVAMGTPIAPTLACFFMHHLESAFCTQEHLQPLIYKRYIDDIFLIWTHGQDSFKLFFDHFNQFHPNITFTCHTSNTSVDYLDLTIFIDPTKPTKLLYKPFHKPTNSFQYVHSLSHHPPSTKKAIIYTQSTQTHQINQ